jgi:hypothetical protein
VRIGEDVQQIAVRRAEQYGVDHWSEAQNQWQDALQTGLDEARQRGNFQVSRSGCARGWTPISNSGSRTRRMAW